MILSPPIKNTVPSQSTLNPPSPPTIHLQPLASLSFQPTVPSGSATRIWLGVPSVWLKSKTFDANHILFNGSEVPKLTLPANVESALTKRLPFTLIVVLPASWVMILSFYAFSSHTPSVSV